MLSRGTLLVFIVTFPCLHFAQSPFSCTQASSVLKSMARYHVQPRDLTAEDQLFVLEEVVSELDPYHLIFLQQDLDELAPLLDGVLDTNANNACQFVKRCSEVYVERSKMNDETITSILEQPLAEMGDRAIRFKFRGLDDFCLDQESLSNRIRSYYYYLAYSTYLSDYANANEQKSFKEVEEEIRSGLGQRIGCDKDDHESGKEIERWVTEIVFNAYALLHDPHSAFFSPIDKQEFQNRLSTEEKSFGILFSTNKEEKIVVHDLLPGGPAWISGRIFEGDKLMAIKTEAGKSIDLLCKTGSDVMAMTDYGEHEILIFHFTHSDGSIETVKLRRGMVEVGENIIRGLVLDGPKKIGYVALPSFYTDWSDLSGLGCANDLAKEILNLKQEGIEGLILDLRYNGGGSMSEALQLAGLFINEGTLLIHQSKGDKARLAKDPNRGMVYSDPLIVLVNGFSASASEIVAAVLQDYNRAIIVGCKTYGKSTGQTIKPLLSSNGNQVTSGDIGSVKVTDLALWRITGESHQAQGVVPDIALPDAYANLYERESQEFRVMHLDKIDRKTYAYPLTPLPKAALQQKSLVRVQSDSNFNAIGRVNEKFASFYNLEQIKGSEGEIRKYFDGWDASRSDLSSVISKKTNRFKVAQHAGSRSITTFDEFERVAIEELQSEILEDIYIHEAYEITMDLISISP